MIVVTSCTRCHFEWSRSSDVRSVTVDAVQPAYKPPCPHCGNRQEEVLVQMQDGDGALEVSHQGGSGTARIL
jgi:hypothetical protein